MAVQTIGIGIDTSASKQGADEFRQQTAQMKGDIEKVEAATKQTEKAIASIRSESIKAAATEIDKLAGSATKATAEIQKMAKSIDAASKGGSSTGLQQIKEHALAAGDGIAKLGSSAVSGALSALTTAAYAVGNGLALIAGAAIVGAGPLMRLGAAGLSALGSIATGALNVVGRLYDIGAAILGPVMSAFKLMAGAVGASGIGFGFLAKAAIETGDAVVLFERRIASIGGDSTSKINEIRTAIIGVSEDTRSSIETGAKEFAKFQTIMSATGTSVAAVRDFVRGWGAELKLAGASTMEAERATVQLAQGFAKGKLELQDLKSIAQAVPGVLERATGMSIAKINATMKSGGDAARNLSSQLFNYFANNADIAVQRLAMMPRTFEEAVQSLKNTWFQSVADMMRDSNFMAPVLESVDRIKAVIGGDAFKKAFGDIMALVTTTAEKLITWATTGETIGATYHRVSNHFANISKYAAAALADIRMLVKAELPWWMPGAEKAGPSAVGKLKSDIDEQSSRQLEGLKSNPFTGAITGDPTAVLKARVADGLDEIRKMASDMPPLEARLRFSDTSVANSKAALVGAAESAIKDTSIAMTKLAADGFQGLDEAVTRPLNQAAEKLTVFREQLQKNEVSPAAFTAVSTVIDDIGKSADATKAKIAEFQQAKDSALAKGDSLGAGIAQSQIEVYSNAVVGLQEQLKEAIRLDQALKSGDYSALGTVAKAAAGTHNARTPETVEKVKKEAGGGKGVEKSMTEKLNLLREENRLGELRMTGSLQQIKQQELMLDIEKNVTREMFVQNRQKAEQIVGELKLKQALKERTEVYNTFKNVGEQVTQGLWDNFMKVGEGTMKWNDALKQSLVQMIKLVAQAVVLKPLMASIGNGFGQAGSSIFGTSVSTSGGWASSLSSMFAMANGGAFDSGIQKFATGGIFDSPTGFSHAGGLGIMGEAGPEAIMPLTRMPGGKLGVQSQGGGASSTVANITFNVSGDLTEETRARIRTDIDAAIQMATPGTIKKSVAAVRQENTRNPNYMRR